MSLSSLLPLLAIGAVSLPSQLASAEPDWSVGAGVTLGTMGFISAGGLGGLGSSPIALSYGVALERRLSGPLWLRLGAAAGYQSADASSLSARHLALAAGLRWAFTELGPVEVSGITSLRFRAAGFDVEAGDGRPALEHGTLSVGGSAGLSAEHAFDEAFSLRLATELVSFNWTRSHQASFQGIDRGDERASAWDASFGLEPSIELRLRF